jgi:hypothetical protein
MKTRTFQSFSHLTVAVVLFLLGSASIVSCQQSGTSLNYGFVSPNTRDDLKLEEAIRGMNSPEEWNLLARAKNLRCVVKRKIRTMRALGSWSDGAEPTILLRTNSDESTMRYLVSRLGREANQKAVLYFHLSSAGSATIYFVRPHSRLRSLARIAQMLDTAGIAFRTLVPTKQAMFVYIVDTEGNLAEKVKNAAKRLRARFSSQKGNASFIGDDAIREKGQAVFAQEIKDFESTHPNLPQPCVSNQRK